MFILKNADEKFILVAEAAAFSQLQGAGDALRIETRLEQKAYLEYIKVYGITLENDLNGDGKNDESDIAELRNFLVGGYPVQLDQKIADINGDGMINVKDVIALRQYLHSLKIEL